MRAFGAVVVKQRAVGVEEQPLVALGIFGSNHAPPCKTVFAGGATPLLRRTPPDPITILPVSRGVFLQGNQAALIAFVPTDGVQKEATCGGATLFSTIGR